MSITPFTWLLIFLTSHFICQDLHGSDSSFTHLCAGENRSSNAMCALTLHSSSLQVKCRCCGLAQTGAKRIAVVLHIDLGFRRHCRSRALRAPSDRPHRYSRPFASLMSVTKRFRPTCIIQVLAQANDGDASLSPSRQKTIRLRRCGA